MKQVFWFLLLHAAFCSTAQTAGKVDSTFGNNGVAILNPKAGEDFSSGLLILPDNKIVLAGKSYGDGSTGLIRLLPNGAPDPGFSGDGIAYSTFTEGTFIETVAAQADGKIVAAGSRYQYPEAYRIFLTRYQTNGDLDLSFGVAGSVYTDLGAGTAGSGAAALQPDGKIVLAGGHDFHFLVLRYLPNGVLDTAFGEKGAVKLAFDGGRLFANRLLIKPDGKILVGGNWWNPNTPFGHSVFAQLLPNGTRDSSFAGTGFVKYSIAPQNDQLIRFALLPNGQIMAASQCFTWTGYPWSYETYLALYRLNADGSADLSFGEWGLQLVEIPEIGAHDMFLQPDGKVVLAGNIADQMALLRFWPDGKTDAGFGTNGVTKFNIPGYLAGDEYMGMQTDGKIIVMGSFDPGNSDLGFAVVRFSSGIQVGTAGPGKAPLPVQLYPNPATDAVVLRYCLPAAATVRIDLFDLQGVLWHTLLTPTQQECGDHLEILRLPPQLPSGIYLLQLKTGSSIISLRFEV